MNKPLTILEPVGGYLIYLYHKLRDRIFAHHSLMKLHNHYLCKTMTDATVSIGIDSFKAVTTKRQSYLFDKIVSVEIDEVLHEIATRRCAKRENVELLLGAGSELLPGIVPRIQGPVIFLDGYFSGDETGLGSKPEFVLKELGGVLPYLKQVKAVVVDYFRSFDVDKGWPRKSEVMAKLEAIFPELA